MVRVFIAVDIEDPVVIGRLASIRDTLVSTGVPMKPVEDQNMHITLRFIGEVPESMVDDIYEAMKPARFKEFTMRLKGLGAFPSITRPRVLWIGVEEGAEELRRIRDTIEAGLRRLGLRPEKERFIPHVTLARVKGRGRMERLVRVLTEYSGYEAGTVVVRSVRLKQSILTPKGPIYRTLREVFATG